MALIPLQLPAGIYRNGTDFQASNRWLDCNLVRWVDGTLQPINGWRTRSDTATDVIARGMYAWRDNSTDRWLMVGTANKLYAYNPAGTQFDVTPVGITTGSVDATTNVGFGGGLYGQEEFGIARTESTGIIPATTWAMDNWGQNWVGCSDADGNLYEWSLVTATPAAVIANAPTNCDSLVVTEERFLFALGAGGNPRKVQWSDREDNTTWTPLDTNEAGDIELQTNGLIQCGLRVQGQTLILTTTDAHVATYVAPPYVYGFERVGTSCGVIGRKAAAVVDAGAFWMGDEGFYAYTGGTVQELRSEVADYIFRDINRGQKSKVWAVSNARHGEIWWFYPSEESTENDRYVIFNYTENTWYIGSIARTAAVDAGAFQYPIYFNPDDLKIYEHEIGWDYGSAVPFAESAPISLGAGDNVLVATDLIPDELTQGQVTAKFKTRFHPNDTEREYGSYTMSNPTSVRFTGRQIRMRVEGAVGADWRVGTMRLEAVAGGRR